VENPRDSQGIGDDGFAIGVTYQQSLLIGRLGGDQMKKVIISNSGLADLLLLGPLAIAIYRDYSTGRDLRRVCELLGAHDFAMPDPRSAEIDNICIKHRPGLSK
jgi:hypothetical protein